MGSGPVQKVIALPLDGDILSEFPASPVFRKVDAVPFLPDDLLAEGVWRYSGLPGLASSYRLLLPVLVFFCDGKILAWKGKSTYRIWFGEPVRQEDIQQYPEISSLPARTLQREHVLRHTPYTLEGYAFYRTGQKYSQFLAVHAAHLSRKMLLKNERWLSLPNIISAYLYMDPLSKCIFDAFYEDRNLHDTYFLFEKTEKNT